MVTSGFICISEGAPEPNAPKIIGGLPAALGQFPHQAGILTYSASICGGSLIARDWVLTAARCAEA
jgi:secreted trypsin-like serine protease